MLFSLKILLLPGFSCHWQEKPGNNKNSRVAAGGE